MKQDLEKRSVQSSSGAAERRQCQCTHEAPAVSWHSSCVTNCVLPLVYFSAVQFFCGAHRLENPERDSFFFTCFFFYFYYFLPNCKQTVKMAFNCTKTNAHRNINAWLNCAAVARSLLASMLTPLHHFSPIFINIHWVCEVSHNQFLDWFVCANSTLGGHMSANNTNGSMKKKLLWLTQKEKEHRSLGPKSDSWEHLTQSLYVWTLSHTSSASHQVPCFLSLASLSLAMMDKNSFYLNLSSLWDDF